MGFQYPHSDKEFSNHSFAFDLPGRSLPRAIPHRRPQNLRLPGFASPAIFLNKFTVSAHHHQKNSDEGNEEFLSCVCWIVRGQPFSVLTLACCYKLLILCCEAANSFSASAPARRPLRPRNANPSLIGPAPSPTQQARDRAVGCCNSGGRQARPARRVGVVSALMLSGHTSKQPGRQQQRALSTPWRRHRREWGVLSKPSGVGL